MNASFDLALRRVLAVVLALGLVLGGIERAAAGVPAATSVTIAGVEIALCAMDGGAADPSGKDRLAHRACDQCSVQAASVLPPPAVPPVPLRFATPARVAADIRTVVPGRAAGLAYRPRGPPAA